MSLKEPALRKIAHQRSDAEAPRRNAAAMVDAVDQRSEPGRGNAHHIADFMGKAKAWTMAILRRRKHGAQKQHETVGVLVIGAYYLGHDIERITADLGQ